MAAEIPEAAPPDDEIVIGLVAAVGINLEEMTAELRAVLSEFGYRSYDLHLTDTFAAFDWPRPLVEAPFDERIWSYMDAGDLLCKEWKRNEAMAMLAVSQIAATRSDLTGDIEMPAPRTAYILRSLKRPAEVEFLRQVYGRRFFAIGISTQEAARMRYLEDRIRQSRIPPSQREPVHTANDIAARDEEDEQFDHGQNVRDTFHRADLFVDLSRNLSDQLTRAFDVVHGDPRRTPTKDELGMMHAATAALRSGELGRQVGAAICTPDGAIVATGCNEVPKAFGGQYWEEEAGDARDVKRGYDTNTMKRRTIGAEIADKLRDGRMLREGIRPEDVLEIVEASHFGDVIEYVRAVHAEMAAIVDAARRSASIDKGFMYTTTFPCHHCARHILAAGIGRVVFISPYAKSLAVDLHGDGLTVGRRSQGREVPFEPFIGIGPRRFGSLFGHTSRKSPQGQLLKYDRLVARARIEDRDPEDMRSDNLPYLQRELRAHGMLAEAERNSGFHMTRED